jgi:hypothetical protein
MTLIQATQNDERGGILGDRLPDTLAQRENRESLRHLQTDLYRFFGVSFTVFDDDGVQLGENDEFDTDVELYKDVIDEVVFARTPVLRSVDGGTLVLGMPLEISARLATICIGSFGSAPEKVGSEGSEEILAEKIDSPQNGLFWNSHQLKRMAECFCERQVARQTRHSHLAKIESLSAQLVHTLEEITLVYELVDLLTSGIRPLEVANVTVERIAQVYPVQCAWLWGPAQTDKYGTSNASESEETFIFSGCQLVSQRNIKAAILELVGAQTRDDMVTANQTLTDRPLWPASEIKQFGAVPVVIGDQQRSWLGICNRTDGFDVGSVEMSMLRCIARLLSLAV